MSPYLLNVPGGPLAGKPLGFAHRGGAARGDENTMAAFRRAWDAGFRYLETDVQLSADGVLYAFHDDTLERVTDGSGAISELRSAAIDALRVVGEADEPPARFTELLAAFPQARLNVDLKSPGTAAAFADAVRAAGAQDRVLAAAFKAKERREAAALLPGLATSASVLAVALSVFLGPLSAPILRSQRRRGVVALQVPHRFGPLTVVRGRWVRRVQAAGLQVHVWVVDDAAQMEELLALGVDGIMTDRLDVLAEVFGRRGAWPQTP